MVVRHDVALFECGRGKAAIRLVSEPVLNPDVSSASYDVVDFSGRNPSARKGWGKESAGSADRLRQQSPLPGAWSSPRGADISADIVWMLDVPMQRWARTAYVSARSVGYDHRAPAGERKGAAVLSGDQPSCSGESPPQCNPGATSLSSGVPLSFSPTLCNPGERAHNDRRDHSGVRYTSSSNRRGQVLACPVGGPAHETKQSGGMGRSGRSIRLPGPETPERDERR